MKNGRHDDSTPESLASIAEGMSPNELKELLKQETIQKIVDKLNQLPLNRLKDIYSEIDKLIAQ